MLRFYRKPALSIVAVDRIKQDAKQRLGIEIDEIGTEWCFSVETAGALSDRDLCVLRWLLTETFEQSFVNTESFLGHYKTQLEVGPRLNFETAWSSTAVSICLSCGIAQVRRLERSLCFGLSASLEKGQRLAFIGPLHDRMTQMLYLEPQKTFELNFQPPPVRIIPLIEQGIDALRHVNLQLGLAMDEQDLQMYYDLFLQKLKRNPTDVEIFQLGTSNSEHCRHGFFKGILEIDGRRAGQNLMDIVKAPWRVNPGNSLIAFCDDSSALRGGELTTLIPQQPGRVSAFSLGRRVYHPTLTAETHNFPSGVAPFPGAETGTGGRIRDNQAVGRGGLVIAAGAAYCTDNLHIPGYELPWEDKWLFPSHLASPLEILIRASDGASDYGNKFGEPVIYGFVRTFGLRLPDARRGWFKPIMYTVGAGQIDGRHIAKGKPEKGMLVVQVGGPAYRIGLGGGPASSMIQGANTAELDFNAVQRGDAQMEQRMNRFVRACVELGESNPIVTIHDLGAGGDCNALPELVDPVGAFIELRSIPLGDQTLSVLEYWGNESQERNAFLVSSDRFEQIQAIAQREDIPCMVVGRITGDGWFVLHDESDGSTPVRLPLNDILGELPPKTFQLQRTVPQRVPLQLSQDVDLLHALERVLRLPSVCSKRFLTTKVDRSVTGLVAQQQCVGPNQITLCDFAVIAQSHFGLTGIALSLGEQPIKGLISASAMARLAVAEAVLNMAGAKITGLQDIKCSANWMLAAKLPGEGAWLYDAAFALSEVCIALGIAIDGGKDSLSMAAKTKSPDGTSEVVKAPGELVIAAYAPMSDITCKVTPDIKEPGNTLLFIDLASGKTRLGGSALAQTYWQVGDECPDAEDPALLCRAFQALQELIEKKLICAVHDRSDGGLITTLLEMAFGGNVGLAIDCQSSSDPLRFFFNEELGLVVECNCPEKMGEVLHKKGLPFHDIGKVAPLSDRRIVICHNGREVLNEDMCTLRSLWEETSFQLDRLQANPRCVAEEAKNIATLVVPPPYLLSYVPENTSQSVLSDTYKPKVAIIRTKGSNGDREMTSAFYLAGFEPWDVTMNDLLSNRVTLDEFRGIAFVGGFADADVFDAAKGWAATIRFNNKLADQFQRFYSRAETFSLGVCNGCQLMTLLGWVPLPAVPAEKQPRFIRNSSERFESRFATVRIMPSPAIMLQGMESSILGVWIAHGEGRCFFPDSLVQTKVIKEDLAPIRFVGVNGYYNHEYPFNPNGSLAGITALCSPDGRHLAMMPHPERTFLSWQWPYWPKAWSEMKISPWLRLFQNARTWCEKH